MISITSTKFNIHANFVSMTYICTTIVRVLIFFVEIVEIVEIDEVFWEIITLCKIEMEFDVSSLKCIMKVYFWCSTNNKTTHMIIAYVHFYNSFS